MWKGWGELPTEDKQWVIVFVNRGYTDSYHSAYSFGFMTAMVFLYSNNNMVMGMEERDRLLGL